MATVQFYGAEQVLQAAENYNCPAWAIFSGTALFMKHENNDMQASRQMLEQALEMLHQSGSVATYKIKFFEVPEKVDRIKITEKSVCDGGSFSFQTRTQEQSLIPYHGRAIAVKESTEKIDKLAEIVAQQQLQIQQLIAMQEEPEEEEEEEPETIGSIFMDALKNPEKMMGLVNVFNQIKSTLTMQPQPMGAIGNLGSQPTPTGAPVTDEEKLNRLAVAIDKLEKADPDLVEHLEKLAAMSESNPQQFNWLIKML